MTWFGMFRSCQDQHWGTGMPSLNGGNCQLTSHPGWSQYRGATVEFNPRLNLSAPRLVASTNPSKPRQSSHLNGSTKRGPSQGIIPIGLETANKPRVRYLFPVRRTTSLPPWMRYTDLCTYGEPSPWPRWFRERVWGWAEPGHQASLHSSHERHSEVQNTE